MKRRCVKLFLLSIALCVYCGSCRKSPVEESAVVEMAYRSRYPVQHIDSEVYKPGYIIYDSNRAASSVTVREAIERWEQYIEDHGEPQDGFSRNYLIGAQIDLMRAYYLAGEVDKGDEILNRFDLTTLEYRDADQ